MATGAAARLREAPATVQGLFAAPCDLLLLALDAPGRPLPPLTATVDWRLAGRFSRLLAGGRTASGGSERTVPVLLPGTPLLPVGRFVLLPRGQGAAELARLAEQLGARATGLCVEDFGLKRADVLAAFGDARVVLFSRPRTAE